MKKENLTKILNDLPSEFELDYLMEKLIFIEKVEKGLEQLNNGNVITHYELKQKTKKWDT